MRPVRDAECVETGMYEIPAGGRRYRALALLVKQRRLAKTAPVPCVVREAGTPEEDSLAENVQRAPLHPLDQFRAFLALREKGQSEEEIAAAQFVPVAVVKQRLRLASVSPKLLDVYAEDGMTLDQLMAFTVNADHARQEQVFERISQSYDKQPYAIRRMLTEGAVKTTDKRALFVGPDAYQEAGGTILRDLFEQDHGGWLQDAGLLDMLVAEKLREEAETIGAEGWKWTEVAPDFAHGHTYGLRRLFGEQAPLTDEEQATRDALQAELDAIEEAYSGGDEDLPDGVDERLAEIESFASIAAMSAPRTSCRSSRRLARGWRRSGRRRRFVRSRGCGHRRRRDRAGRAGGGRRAEADPRPAGERADRAPHAGAAPCAWRTSGDCVRGGAPCALPARVLPLCAG